MENELNIALESESENANKIVVVDEPSYLLAGNEVKELASLRKNIVSYWKEPKSSAYQSWKNICKKEKDMLEKVDKDIDYLKKGIGDYQLLLEDEAEKEKEKVKEEYGVDAVAEVDLPKIKGVSSQDTWEIKEIDLEKLPKTLLGVALVKVDESAIKKLIKASKGKIEIPGVTYSKNKIIKTTSR